MKKYIFLVILLTPLFFSCEKERNESFEYLIFGHFYGECIGEDCIANFKIEDGKLFEDKNDSYNGSGGFDFVKLDDSLYDLIKSVASEIPEDLLDKEDQTFGCPDCADKGGIFIEYNDGENIKKWSIDQNKNAIPKYLHSYLDLINEKINLLL